MKSRVTSPDTGNDLSTFSKPRATPPQVSGLLMQSSYQQWYADTTMNISPQPAYGIVGIDPRIDPIHPIAKHLDASLSGGIALTKKQWR
jgi:hypothetical protein